MLYVICVVVVHQIKPNQFAYTFSSVSVSQDVVLTQGEKFLIARKLEYVDF
jgi:hypothetical protein